MSRKQPMHPSSNRCARTIPRAAVTSASTQTCPRWPYVALGEPLCPLCRLGFPRGEPIMGKTRTLRRRSCSDRAARSPSYRFGALPLAVGLACGQFYRRPARAPGRLGRPGTVLPGSAPDLARCIFLRKFLCYLFQICELLKFVEK
jgi:hypothetical protein